MSFEESLVRNAAPVLAGLKVAGLFNYPFSDLEDCAETLRRMNAQMNERGVFIELFHSKGSFFLIFIYRKSLLQRELGRKDLRTFLRTKGYEDSWDMRQLLAELRKRICEQPCFPHEIGVFLGYPLEDVEAFIDNQGQGCLLCGEWKVYHNEQAAVCLFCKWNHCRDVYVKLFLKGRKLSDMTVCA